MVHVRRRIYRAQRTIEVECGEIRRYVDASRDEGLEAITRPNVLLDALDTCLEVRPTEARFAFRRLGAEIGRNRGERRRLVQTRKQIVELRDRLLVLVVQIWLAGVRIDRYRHDDARPTVQVIQDHQRPREDEHRIWCGNSVRRAVGKLLDQSNRVVREKANRTAPELPELRHIRGTRVVYEGGEVAQGVGRPTRVVPAEWRAPVFNHAVRKSPGSAWLGAEIGIACPCLATSGSRLEQESKRPLFDFCKRRHRRVSVEQTIFPDRYQRRVPRSPLELLEAHRARTGRIAPAMFAATNFLT